ncbi:MAG: hypothetical protein JWN44_1392 [Myxococcales bacterium]|nr:hypothetical protein [Myxococcales bacterium]
MNQNKVEGQKSRVNRETGRRDGRRKRRVIRSGCATRARAASDGERSDYGASRAYISSCAALASSGPAFDEYPLMNLSSHSLAFFLSFRSL